MRRRHSVMCTWNILGAAIGRLNRTIRELKHFKIFFRGMEDLTQKNHGIRGKASEVERQLRDSVLEVCCEEQMVKLSRQVATAMEEERAEQLRAQQENGEEKVRREHGRGMRRRINWADVEDDGHFGE